MTNEQLTAAMTELRDVLLRRWKSNHGTDPKGNEFMAAIVAVLDELAARSVA